jgi:tRNA 5-methylaminomethyl-2-thiouridine biosynthesis bifunctional protein
MASPPERVPRPTTPPVAELEWRDGQPVSRRFGDVFFSRHSGNEESVHVFLGGNRLAERWAGLADGAVFAIGETGFGTGLNFANAWSLWDRVAPPGARLHYLSVEGYPLAPAELAAALAAWPALAGQRESLVAQWERFAPGWHRLAFAEGRVVLTLLVGDVAAVLPRLAASIDAWFLDGFAPAKNPAMWTAAVLSEVARLTRPGGTFATYTAAGGVRRRLAAAGFDVRKVRGFGPKREMLCGELPPGTPKPWRPPWYAAPAPASERRAIVLGAGLAGAATAAAFASRGWVVTVVDRRGNVAAEASGNHQGVLYAHPSAHPSALGELVLTGLQHSIRCFRAAPASEFSACGVLQLAFDDAEAARQDAVHRLGLPPALLQGVDRATASEIAGMPMPAGGLHFPGAGWARPRGVCEALLASGQVRVVLGADVASLVRDDAGWTVCAAGRPVAAAPVVVIAASGASIAFPQLAHLPLRLIGGQVTHLPETPASAALRTVVCGEGYAAPAWAGLHTIGATHRLRDPSAELRPAEHAENLARLYRLAPALHAALGGHEVDPTRLDGRAGVRCSSPDFLPIVGPIVDAPAFARVYGRLARDASLRLDDPPPWLDGLYVNTAHGSRGLVTGPIAGEVLACIASDEPAPLPGPLLEALHPSRFLLRALVRRRPARV